MSKELVNLILDASRGKVQNYANGKEGYVDDAVRKAFEEILGGKFSYASWRRHKNEIFEIIEETLVSALPDAWKDSEFFNELCEIKNVPLGDKNEFIVEDDNYLIASKFSGNHWDTNRIKLLAKEGFSVPTYWIHMRIYEEFERFMKGLITLPEMYAAIEKGFNRYVNASVYAAFSGISAALPAEFIKTGSYSKDDMAELVARVQTASQKEVIIAGTKTALAKINADATLMSDSMKDELNKNGIIRLWEGVQTVEIPQVFNVGTYEFKLPSNVVYVIPRDNKPIKIVWEGDVRTRELEMHDTHDQTIDVDVQAKFGSALVLNELIGQYTISAGGSL